jgi:hypothetical protein
MSYLNCQEIKAIVTWKLLIEKNLETVANNMVHWYKERRRWRRFSNKCSNICVIYNITENFSLDSIDGLLSYGKIPLFGRILCSTRLKSSSSGHILKDVIKIVVSFSFVFA